MRPGPRVTARKDGTTMAYWFNIETQQVETDDNRSQGEDVMGPYETEAEAAAALATARAKTEAWDEEDRKEREWQTGDAGA
ncbi:MULTISPECIES: methionine aminopeptidase [Janibacter]|uniref:Methionine aminopeptidase n=2 Tax=Janibacter indicus TaxID=857417 RepID=A0A1W2B2E7_9MICO|nr:methionine aminopeptidase [Janibacter indicus]SMC67153.1 hypothetical protein SAMN06296429_10733 [Janibacter indicus]